MKYIVKKNLNYNNIQTKIRFVYNVELNTKKLGFVNFDVGNEEEKIDYILKNLNLEETSKPLYVILSEIFFEKIENLYLLEFENDKHVSVLKKDDLK